MDRREEVYGPVTRDTALIEITHCAVLGLVDHDGEIHRMRRTLIAMATALVLLLGLTMSVGAQADLGNDGVDMDCADFPEQNAAQGYFESDGGSADRNVDRLDPGGDGIACEASDQLAEDTSDGDTGNDDDGDIDTSPTTGTGPMAGSDAPGMILLLAGSAVCTLTGLRLARRA